MSHNFNIDLTPLGRMTWETASIIQDVFNNKLTILTHQAYEVSIKEEYIGHEIELIDLIKLSEGGIVAIIIDADTIVLRDIFDFEV